MVQVVQIIKVIPLPLHHKVWFVLFSTARSLAVMLIGGGRWVARQALRHKRRGVGFFPTTTCRSVNPQALLLKVLIQYVICKDKQVTSCMR